MPIRAGRSRPHRRPRRLRRWAIARTRRQGFVRSELRVESRAPRAHLTGNAYEAAPPPLEATGVVARLHPCAVADRISVESSIAGNTANAQAHHCVAQALGFDLEDVPLSTPPGDSTSVRNNSGHETWRAPPAVPRVLRRTRGVRGTGRLRRCRRPLLPIFRSQRKWPCASGRHMDTV